MGCLVSIKQRYFLSKICLLYNYSVTKFTLSNQNSKLLIGVKKCIALAIDFTFFWKLARLGRSLWTVSRGLKEYFVSIIEKCERLYPFIHSFYFYFFFSFVVLFFLRLWHLEIAAISSNPTKGQIASLIILPKVSASYFFSLKSWRN